MGCSDRAVVPIFRQSRYYGCTKMFKIQMGTLFSVDSDVKIWLQAVKNYCAAQCMNVSCINACILINDIFNKDQCFKFHSEWVELFNVCETD